MNYDRHGGDIYTHSGVKLDFSMNVNPLGTPPEVAQAVRDSARLCAAYPDPRCRALTRTASNVLDLPEEYFVFGNGAADLIIRLTMALHPQKALVTAPAFSEYENAVRLSGGAVSCYNLSPENGFRIGPGYAKAVTHDTDLVFLCNPNNPTGSLAQAGTVEALLDACEKAGAYLVVDECFLDFTRGISQENYLEAHKNLILLRAFTKIYAMAGLRLGYLLCSDSNLCERVYAWGQSWSVSTPAQLAGIAALRCLDYPARTRAFLEEERPRVMAALREMGMAVSPSDGNFLLFRGQAGLWEQMLNRGIMLRACGNYRNLDETYYRIGLKDRKKNDILLTTLKEIQERGETPWQKRL